MAIGLIILTVILSTFAHLLGSIFACLITGIKIEAVQFFFGKSLFKFKTRVLNIEFGYLPIGGSVKYDLKDFDSRNLFTRLGIIISGPIFILILASLFLTLPTSFIEMTIGIKQLIEGYLSPIVVGQKLINSYMQLVISNSYEIVISIISTKIAAFNLLPIPSLNGGQFLLELLQIKKTKFALLIFSIGYFISLTILLVWIFSFVYWFVL